ncbi:isopentenyl-diphosphate Delta-isomerase [Patescibacteria group bacterium]
MSNEQVVLVNKNGKSLGLKEKIFAHKNPVSLHKAISVLIFDKEKVLIQKRAKNKKTWPLFWSNTCCSHPRGNESFQKAAERRLFEEMGIKTKLRRKFRIIYQDKFNKDWGENEYDWVFIGNYSGKLNPDPREIMKLKWISLKKLREDIKKNPKKYTPWFKIILTKLEK